MDIKDQRILYELELAARDSFSQIGKRVGLSKETTNNRVKILERNGVIRGYNAIINIARLGYTGYAIFSRLENITEEKKKELIADLEKNENVYWIALLGGNYDLLFAIQARSILEFNEIYREIQNKYGSYLKDNVISIRAQVSQFRRSYLVGKKVVEKPPYFGKEVSLTNLDQTDKKILNFISNDGRVSTVDLAKKTNIARTTIHNRLRHLQKSGIIQGFSTLIHPENFNFQIYQLMVSVNSISEDVKKKIYFYCLNNPHITFYVDCVGKWNFEMTCEVESQQKLQELLMDLRTNFKELITNIEIVMTFNYFVKYKLFVD